MSTAIPLSELGVSTESLVAVFKFQKPTFGEFEPLDDSALLARRMGIELFPEAERYRETWTIPEVQILFGAAQRWLDAAFALEAPIGPLNLVSIPGFEVGREERIPPPRPYRLVGFQSYSPVYMVVEFSPYVAITMAAGLVLLAERLRTFKARTNAKNKRSDLKATIYERLRDEVYQGKLDAVVALELMEGQQHVAAATVDVLEPGSPDDPKPLRLTAGES